MDASYLARLIETEERRIASLVIRKWEEPRCIPILLTGGVGDVIMSAAIVDTLWREFGPIEIFSKHYEAFNHFKPKGVPFCESNEGLNTTWYLAINSVAQFVKSDGFIGFSTSESELLFQTQRAHFDQNPGLEKLVKHHPLFDGAVARYAARARLDRRQFPFQSLGLPAPLVIFPERFYPPKKTITIHDGYETESFVQTRATKTWDLEAWAGLVARIKREFPDYEIIQLGSKTSREIRGVDRCLINQTTILEAFDLIEGGALHIDGDSGLVHAATVLGVPCVVLFGPTPPEFYGYRQNANLRSDHCPSACYWLSQSWLAHCPIGLPEPECMNSITVDQVFAAVSSKLQSPSTSGPGCKDTCT